MRKSHCKHTQQTTSAKVSHSMLRMMQALSTSRNHSHIYLSKLALSINYSHIHMHTWTTDSLFIDNQCYFSDTHLHVFAVTNLCDHLPQILALVWNRPYYTTSTPTRKRSIKQWHFQQLSQTSTFALFLRAKNCYWKVNFQKTLNVHKIKHTDLQISSVL